MISIANKLEVIPGGVIQVPGCEPVSSLTGTALLRDMHCNASIIPVSDVLRLIPGSKLVWVMRPSGTTSTGWFVQLPEGPPTQGNDCPGHCIADYYAILKANARVLSQEESEEAAGPCAGFNYSGCVNSRDIFHTTRDPDMRPNSQPLGAVL